MTRLHKLLLMLLLALVPMARAQTTETLTGIVTDPSGAVIANATVTLHSDEPVDNLTAQTTSTGAFTVTIPMVEKRIYRAIVHGGGFRDVREQAADALSGQAADAEHQAQDRRPGPASGCRRLRHGHGPQ